jgi:hypothetical protein
MRTAVWWIGKAATIVVLPVLGAVIGFVAPALVVLGLFSDPDWNGGNQFALAMFLPMAGALTGVIGLWLGFFFSVRVLGRIQASASKYKAVAESG